MELYSDLSETELEIATESLPVEVLEGTHASGRLY